MPPDTNALTAAAPSGQGALFIDLSHLPPAAPAPDNPDDPRPPLPSNQTLVVGLLAQQWMQAEQEAGPRPRAHATTWRFSDAGDCARALSLNAAGFPREPMGLAGYWTVGLGTLIHDHVEKVVQATYPDASVEVVTRLEDADASGHVDLVIRSLPCFADEHDEGVCCTDGLRTVLLELKTVGGFRYKKQVGERGAPEGPGDSNLMQVSLQAAAISATEPLHEVRIGALARESISIQATGRSRNIFDEQVRFGAEWIIPTEEWQTRAKAEIARLNGIRGLLDSDTPMIAATVHPDPELPPGAKIVEPSKGRWEVLGVSEEDGEQIVADSGNWWACVYCSQAPNCISIGEHERIGLEEAWRRVLTDQPDLDLSNYHTEMSPLETRLAAIRDKAEQAVREAREAATRPGE